MTNVQIHPLADVQSVTIGEGTQIWQYAVILKGAKIGKDCNINCHTFIENDVKIGNKVTIKSGIYLWDSIEIGNDVFIGPNVTFVNHNYPRSKQYLEDKKRTIIHDFVSIGAASIILSGINIGEYAMIGAGSVVTKSIPPYALVMGNPARIRGKVDKDGKVIERF